MPEPIVFIRKAPVARAMLTAPEALGLLVAQLMVVMGSDVKLRGEGHGYSIDEITLSVDTSEAEMRLTVTFAE